MYIYITCWVFFNSDFGERQKKRGGRKLNSCIIIHLGMDNMDMASKYL